MSGDEVVVSATVERPGGERSRLWYRVPRECREAITPLADPFVLGILFFAMKEGQDIIVAGALSSSLIDNLERFQAQWHAWRPRWYNSVAISATKDYDEVRTAAEPATLLAFSGGVDSCFSALTLRRSEGASEASPGTGLMVHGFDIPLAEQRTFNRAADNSEQMLASLEMRLLRMSTNFREIPQRWEDAHGAGIASCLTLVGEGYSTGLIGSGPSDRALVLPYGSNPITDPLLSGGAIRIVHSGTEFSRLEKIRQISSWDEATRRLRVCWEGPSLDANCCRCEKCIRNILGFRALGLGLPSCFPRDVTDAQIRRVRAPQAQIDVDFVPILLAAETAGIAEDWVEALRTCIRRNRRRNRLRDLWRRFK